MLKHMKCLSSLISVIPQDVENLKGFAQNKIIYHAILSTWFQKVKSDGIIYNKYFNPILLETLALLFTMVSASLGFLLTWLTQFPDRTPHQGTVHRHLEDHQLY